jgi:branched-chain amino acid transport system permease protein
MMLDLLGILLDGIALGALLFMLAIGLSITLGLMGFVNLAHTSFAMFGGYLLLVLMTQYHWNFFASLPVVFLAVGAAGIAVERALFRPLYRAGSLDQVLLTVGVLTVSTAVAAWIWGPRQQSIVLPDILRGRLSLGPLSMSTYRLFLLAIGVTLLGLLLWVMERTRFGAMVRASVDNQRVANAVGIPVNLIFQAAFAAASGLAALGGALGIEVLGLDPTFPAKNLVLCLMVVVVGGPGSIVGTFLSAMLLGICDVLGKFYLPQIGAFVLYAVMVLVLVFRPRGLRGPRNRTA